MDEGLAVNKLDGDTAALKLCDNGMFDVNLWVGHLLLHPNAFDVGAFGLEGLDKVGDHLFWNAEADEQVGTDVTKA